ncbi:pyridoxamine 5'-phosphate oxidase family protein [Staphylococcus pasteuri]|uniref:Pyridoxamine 5'-phosphate oxidase family protein n=3 Tax=Staphylococcus TaxID=1279 RepID=A0AAW7YRM2_9STAP|nr:hypothetical protein [Staphylococcus pasteuri]MDO6573702.1 pyridoxamine 5'-phosphate oxidase family protein [Staphylococcus pasteuri_A]KKI55811.1 Hydroxyaromatic non-oxidative decarboxylase protein D [Staphylococcus pasteuri]MCF7599571.1 pyridoxamine 5'-phosphate oxidase family protein [Staphylococcus pasteuri]MDI3232024.1 pyridoxamine 5'-phosphate oxidase family protein [Staphylococcus pasteuri]MEB6209173.1 pyridoxamine 5'-phosphate oxidase family protein [Staphylococcus pasteuri]
MKLSNEVVELLNGKQLNEKQDLAMMLQSVTEDGYPHTAMVSVGEVVAVNSEQLRIALWPDTKTTNSLIKLKKASLVIVHNHKVNYIELDVNFMAQIQIDSFERACFEANVKSFKEDVAKYADIDTGITITLKDPEDVLQRWRTTIDRLLEVSN